MKILVLSDLHFSTNEFVFKPDELRNRIQSIIGKELEAADLVAISGDVVEASIMKFTLDPLQILYQIFQKEVVFCLGNHEFAYNDYSDVINYWKQFKHEHVHCLDVDGHFVKDNVNFVGNVFWYDFSLNENPTVMQGEILDGWLDATIKNFDPIKENKKCQEQILSNLSKDKTNILITHTVPHRDLNSFSREQPYSPYNAYSGNMDFIQTILDSNYKVEYALCGHTHRREMKEIHRVYCINIGNDYYFKTGWINSMIIEL